MASIKRGFNYLFHNKAQFCDSIVKNYMTFLPDKLYLSLRYKCKMGRWINWKNPKTFTEKIQWLKVYNRKPESTIMVDKYAVKEYVAEKIGKQYIIPTIAVWDTPEDIKWNELPKQFVLKTTHGGGGGGVVLCRDKDSLNKEKVIKQLNDSMNFDIYTSLREWPYKNVKKRIIAEEFIVTEKGSCQATSLLDYKFFCFNGKVRFFKVDFGRFVEHHANYYSPDGELLEFGESGLAPDPTYKIELPDNLGIMINIAEKLSCNQSFLRVDLYNVDGKIYFGELTFYPASGLIPWTPDSFDEIIGNYIELEK